MRALTQTSKFKKSLKKAKKRGKNLNKLSKIISQLQKEGTLPPKFRPHRLTGNWTPFWECHIEPDWLLIYDIDDEFVTLIELGTHSDLFN